MLHSKVCNKPHRKLWTLHQRCCHLSNEDEAKTVLRQQVYRRLIKTSYVILLCCLLLVSLHELLSVWWWVKQQPSKWCVVNALKTWYCTLLFVRRPSWVGLPCWEIMKWHQTIVGYHYHWNQQGNLHCCVIIKGCHPEATVPCCCLLTDSRWQCEGVLLLNAPLSKIPQGLWCRVSSR